MCVCVCVRVRMGGVVCAHAYAGRVFRESCPTAPHVTTPAVTGTATLITPTCVISLYGTCDTHTHAHTHTHTLPLLSHAPVSSASTVRVTHTHTHTHTLPLLSHPPVSSASTVSCDTHTHTHIHTHARADTWALSPHTTTQ